MPNSPQPMQNRHDGGRRGGREPAFNIPGVVLVFAALCVGIFLLQAYVLTPRQNFELLIAGAFIPLRYSGDYGYDLYAFTSPFTYSLMHGGVAHLVVNMIWLAAFGSPLANRQGNLRFVAFWAVTALAAALLHYVLHPLSDAPLVGASGAISGMMGAAARYGFWIDRTDGRSIFAGPILGLPDILRSRTVATFLGVWMVINIVTGLAGAAPGGVATIAWEAHIGGFLAGFLGVRLFDRKLPA
ncbi:rhomboid family intramembrane serine protease [Mesorhizobium xinjiangense]|uniref:rhomboid family intramembrane serine protease n=1 Tax=Mesorhizobium xinjiangense TaxID=2678685 RepID=UPI0012EDD479|nr:rhomboid family intramembrane serine protease [Mesorhizobium xinjiangense]